MNAATAARPPLRISVDGSDGRRGELPEAMTIPERLPRARFETDTGDEQQQQDQGRERSPPGRRYEQQSSGDRKLRKGQEHSDRACEDLGTPSRLRLFGIPAGPLSLAIPAVANIAARSTRAASSAVSILNLLLQSRF